MTVNNFKYYFISTIILIVFGCSNQSNNTYVNTNENGEIEFDMTSALESEPVLCLDDMIDSIQIIPLETLTQSLLSDRICNICISPQNIYIGDHSNVVIFSRQGEWIKTLDKGAGPKEIGFPASMTYDEKNNYLFIYDDKGRKIMKFTSKGEPLSYNTTNLYIADISISDNLMFIAHHYGQDYNFAITTVDTIGNVDKTFEFGIDQYFFNFDKYILPYNNGFNIKKLLDNKIYYLKHDTLKAKYNLKYPALNVDYSHYKKLSELESILQEGEYLYTGQFLETQDYLFTIFRTKGFRTMDLFTNKKTGKSVCRALKHHSVTSLIRIQPTLVYDNNWFVGTITPESLTTKDILEEFIWDGSNPNNLISDEDMAKLKAVKPDDNPIIVLFKLKDNI